MLLGVDGGGTKTALVLVGRDGALLASHEAPSTYSVADGVALATRVLGEAVPAVLALAGARPADVEHAFFGLPGYGEVVADVPGLDAAPAGVLGHERYACGNDMVCAWAGSLAGADGINVIAGTGSMAYGERAGRGARVGGWGELFGDEGSAHWVAVRGLAAFSRMSDGRLPVGPLHAALTAHLGLGADLELVDVVLGRWASDRSRVAALSRVVAAAADSGDAAATAILDDAGRELAVLVATARAALGFGADDVVPVSHSGGMFSAPLVQQSFARAVGELPEPFALREPLHTPVVGAAIQAARLSGEPLTEAALARLAA